MTWRERAAYRNIAKTAFMVDQSLAERKSASEGGTIEEKNSAVGGGAETGRRCGSTFGEINAELTKRASKQWRAAQ